MGPGPAGGPAGRGPMTPGMRGRGGRDGPGGPNGPMGPRGMDMGPVGGMDGMDGAERMEGMGGRGARGMGPPGGRGGAGWDEMGPGEDYLKSDVFVVGLLTTYIYIFFLARVCSTVGMSIGCWRCVLYLG